VKAEDLTIRSLEGLKVLAAIDHDVHEIHGFTVETDMRTGETVVILALTGPEPMSTSARDFEPHPGYEEFNEWLWDDGFPEDE
jgi:hypothetical protein